MRSTICGVLVALLIVVCPVAADESKLDDQAWRETARVLKLSPEAIDRLARDRFVITDETFAQVFTPYVDHQKLPPPFITPDSVLAGYNVLFEISLQRLERGQMARLGDVLRSMWTRLGKAKELTRGDAKMVDAAVRRAKIITATSLTLLDPREMNPPLDADLAPIVKEEIARVTRGVAIEKPAWLGPPDDGFRAIDYSRFRPRGIYDRYSDLQRYFRSLAYLSAIPMRISHDDELACAVVLATSVNEHHSLSEFLETYRQLMGPSDDLSLDKIADEPGKAFGALPAPELQPKDLARARKSIRFNARLPEINDQQEEETELSARVCPANRLLDAAMFSRTTDPTHFQRPFPTGLEVAVMLGCDRAADFLEPHADHHEELLGAIRKSSRELDRPGGSIYERYLRTLATLFATPAADVPAPFNQPGWQLKSCQTALSGWALQRHAVALHAKEVVDLWGTPHPPPGFIEPSPEFFASVANLVEASEAAFQQAGAFEPDLSLWAVQLSEIADGLEKLATPDQLQTLLNGRGPEQRRLMWAALEKDAVDFYSVRARGPRLLRAAAERLSRREIPPGMEQFVRYANDLPLLWRQLHTLSLKLSAMCNKQLRKAEWTEPDIEFFREYGINLAKVMQYEGESYAVPEDDAPRVIDVYTNKARGFLEVGVARPQAIYVLYPSQGKLELCRGAVFPYVEFVSPERLTDAQWKARLDEPKKPMLPEWVRPIYSPAELGRLPIRHREE